MQVCKGFRFTLGWLALAIAAVTFVLPAAAAAQSGLNANTHAALQATVAFKFPFVYIGKGGNVFMSDTASGEGSPVTGDSSATPDGTPSGQYVYTLLYGQFAWAPAGDAFAYTERMNQVLYGVQNGKAPVVITKGLDRTFPPSFTSDGKEVAYLVMTPQKVGDASVFQIQAAPVGGGSPHALGSLNISMLCGGDMFDPGDQAYFGEQGLLGDSPTTFKFSKFGYLYSIT